MLKILNDLNITLNELLDTLDDVFNIVVSDTSVLDNLDDEIINEIYSIAQNIEISWIDFATVQ